jgi:hypothetical protein
VRINEVREKSANCVVPLFDLAYVDDMRRPFMSSREELQSNA